MNMYSFSLESRTLRRSDSCTKLESGSRRILNATRLSDSTSNQNSLPSTCAWGPRRPFAHAGVLLDWWPAVAALSLLCRQPLCAASVQPPVQPWSSLRETGRKRSHNENARMPHPEASNIITLLTSTLDEFWSCSFNCLLSSSSLASLPWSSRSFCSI